MKFDEALVVRIVHMPTVVFISTEVKWSRPPLWLNMELDLPQPMAGHAVANSSRHAT
jgi:hypothetical protein